MTDHNQDPPPPARYAPRILRYPPRLWRRLRNRVRRERKPAPPLPESRVLRIMLATALTMIALLVLAAAVASFTESYDGLYDWAGRHGYDGFWRAAWPLQVDTFIAVGELTLFVALVARWRARSRWPAWAVTITGLAVSVAGNIGHVHSHVLTTRLTAAVPPLSAAFALAVGLGVLKRIIATVAERSNPYMVSAPSWNDAQTAAADALARTLAAGNPYSKNQIGTRFRLSRPEVDEVFRKVTAAANGHGPVVEVSGEH